MSLLRYTLRRAVWALVLLWAIATASFVLLQIAPGDRWTTLPVESGMSREAVEALRAHEQPPGPAGQRYAHWIASLAHADLGISSAYRMPVSTLLRPRIAATLRLTAAAMALSWLLAVPLGVLAASERGRSRLDTVCGWITSALLMLPEVILASLLLVLVVRSAAVPAGSIWPPLLVLILSHFPVVFRHTRAAVREAGATEFAAAARQMGIPERRIWFHHALRAAAPTLIPLFGLALAHLASASLLVEAVFGWPGVGPMFVEAVLARDLDLVAGPVLVSALFLTAGNLVADLLLYVVDPRIQVS